MTNEQDMQRQLLWAMDAAIQHFSLQHGDNAAMTVMRLEECKEIVAKAAASQPAVPLTAEQRVVAMGIDPSTLQPKCAVPVHSNLEQTGMKLEPAVPAAYDRKCIKCSEAIYQGVLCAHCHAQPKQPPCDDAHVAPDCELFSDPTKKKAVPADVAATPSNAEIQLAAWHKVFGTTQLTHAIARLESAERELAQAKAEVERLKKECHETDCDKVSAREERDLAHLHLGQCHGLIKEQETELATLRSQQPAPGASAAVREKVKEIADQLFRDWAGDSENDGTYTLTLYPPDTERFFEQMVLRYTELLLAPTAPAVGERGDGELPAKRRGGSCDGEP